MVSLNRKPHGPDSLHNCIERGWKFYAERPWLGGLFYWTGFDYRGEPNPMVFPATSSEFGILDYCGFPKDEAYYLKAWWTPEPVLHILPHWHDNETLVGWFDAIKKEEQTMARKYLCDERTPKKYLYKSFISLAMRSVAKYCIIPMQDYLGLDNKSRTNQPSTIGTNWRWRVTEAQLSDELKQEIRETTIRYGRMNWQGSDAGQQKSPPVQTGGLSYDLTLRAILHGAFFSSSGRAFLRC